MSWVTDDTLLLVTIGLAVAWAIFLVALIWPGFPRFVARGLRRTWLARIVRPEYYVKDLLLWSRHIVDAMLSITKTYDWRVSQWSGFATAILTATLAFVSAVVVEYFKDTIYTNVAIKLRVAVMGILASILVYLISQRRISLLKEQFRRVYTLLQRAAEE